MTNQNPPQKNIVYDSTIIAGGNVHIGEARFQEIVAQLPQSWGRFEIDEGRFFRWRGFVGCFAYPLRPLRLNFTAKAQRSRKGRKGGRLA